VCVGLAHVGNEVGKIDHKKGCDDVCEYTMMLCAEGALFL